MKKLFFIIILINLVSCTKDKYPDLKEGVYAEITTNKGVIITKLEFEKTPITVANFILLSEGKHPYIKEEFKNKNFYDGLSFQLNGMLVQSVNPKSTNNQLGYTFEDELPTGNEGDFLFTHNKAGILSMANFGRNTNSTSFFITLNEAPTLDGKYTVFGNVVKGMDVLKKLSTNDKIVKVVIIRKGKSANNFNALNTFKTYYKALSEKKDKEYAKIKKKTDRAKKAKKQMRNFIFNNKKLAKTYPSGLRMLITKKGTENKPKKDSQVYVDFAGFLEDGSLFGTTVLKTAEIFNQYDEQFDQDNKYHPIIMLYSNKAKLIKGLKEGLQKMQYGEKAMLFIPAKLAYGKKGDGYKVPPNTDLVIEVEILDKKIE